MRTNIYASYDSAIVAKKAAGALLDHGVDRSDISLVVSESSDGDSNLDSVESGISTTTAADSARGAKVGAGVGLGIGALAAIASVLVPGVGLVLGGGALAMAIGGAAATTAAGAIAGGVTGYLKDQGAPTEFVDRAHQKIQTGGAVLSVTLPSNSVTADEASQIMAKYGETGYEKWSANSVDDDHNSPTKEMVF